MGQRPRAVEGLVMIEAQTRAMICGETFAGRRVLVTGHTGFKGSWLALWLSRLGAHVTGYALPPQTSPALFAAGRIDQCLHAHHEGDIRDRSGVARVVTETEPEVVFHLAAQSLVLEGYRAPAETFDVNVMGTAAVLEAIRALGRPCAVIIVTSDKCYENREHVWGYREIDVLGGRDPYSASKGTAEIVVASYRQSFFHPQRLGRHGVQLATVRAGNVIGGGDWAADRIVADLARGIASNEPVLVRSPRAVRPWQHVLEPLSGYLILAARMLNTPSSRWCEAWNFGPLPHDALTVREVAEAFIAAWGQGTWVDRSDPNQPEEAHLLRLNIDKALAELNWRPRWDISRALERTAAWYRGYYNRPESARESCLADITCYEQSVEGIGADRAMS
jgi:CDP-glucose 4,6-dehydratase